MNIPIYILNWIKKQGGGSQPTIDWSQIGYASEPPMIQNGFDYAKQIYDNWDPSITSMNAMFEMDNNLIYFPNVDFSHVTDMRRCFYLASSLEYIDIINTSAVTNFGYAFSYTNIKELEIDISSALNFSNGFIGCYALESINLKNSNNCSVFAQCFNSCRQLKNVSLIDTSNAENIESMFNGCTSLESVPQFDFSKATSGRTVFAGCSVLKNVPVFNFSKITSIGNMFQNCPQLTNESLNNIMASCISMTDFTGTKTLKQLGLTSDQATICQGLSNYSDFLAAGWTTGY